MCPFPETAARRRPTACLAAGAALAFAALVAPSPARAAGVTLPVPTITIYPGETIKDTVLVEREFPPSTGQLAVVRDADALVGKVARRTLLPGRVVPQNAVEEAKLVVRGETTQIVFQADGLVISTLVTPLESGGAGDRVRARNLDSGLVIVGVVQDDGSLRVGTP
ncbi:flagellar basal body P-ring formation chaperone FlgA [Salinarimonas rosea]|uniref:flagellar basal body P-ring formation chaperone FlgA n=1 Tax=Salinarimonas rosea TaxID=552063 RepID=UPI000427F0E0|nr:flagellar basal body P-ring formation chaperone FlgA [Salinarimonas rosea]